MLQDIGLFQTNEPNKHYTESYEPNQNAMWQTFAKTPAKSVTIDGNLTTPPQSCGFTTGDYHLRYYLVNGEPFFKEEHSFTTPTSPTPTQMTPPVFHMRPGRGCQVPDAERLF